MKKKKYVFISNMAAPTQVKFSYALQEYFDVEFWFYEHIDETRPSWWKIPLGPHNKILKGSYKLPKLGYVSLGVFYELIRYRPDIIVLGGFMKWNWIILHIAKIFNIKVALMSEPLRFVKHDNEQSSTLLTRENSEKKIKKITNAFKKVDLYIGMGDIAVNQFIVDFKLPNHKVARLFYPQDIENYYQHPLRVKEKGERINFLFASRLVSRYQPLTALNAFAELSLKHDNIYLYMNSMGELKEDCEQMIVERKIKHVIFLENISSWDQMHEIYEHADVLLLPAMYSNGSNALIEARASGLGVVMSNKIHNVSKHSLHEESCFICDPNKESFVRYMEKYLLNPELIYNHGKISKELIEDRRNINIAKTYFETFRNKGLVK